MKFTVRPKKTYYLDEPKCLKEGLVWLTGHTNHGTSVYQIEGIGEWEAPGGSWFAIINGVFVFAVLSKDARPRLSKRIETLEDVVAGVNRMLLKLQEWNGFLASAAHGKRILNTRYRFTPTEYPKERDRCFCFTVPQSPL